MNYNMLKTIYQKTLRNERGGMAALLSVIVLSLIMVSTLSSFYIYLENRAKFQERLRMNYQMGYVMEDVGKAITQARDQFLAGNCPTAATGKIFIDCAEVCGAPVPSSANLAGYVQNAVCVKNDTLNKIVNSSDYFCAYNAKINEQTTMPAYCATLAENDTIETPEVMVATAESYEKSKINEWYSRLDNFFDTTIIRNAPILANKFDPILESKFQAPTMFGWILPQVSYAVTNPPTDPCLTNPDYPGCTPVTQPTQTTPDLSACASHPTTSCSMYCSTSGGTSSPPSFCDALKAAITLKQIGEAQPDGSFKCTTTSTDARCKKCGRLERIAGTCIKTSICPPWESDRTCASKNSGVGNATVDQRIHQMIKLDDVALVAVAPPLGGPMGGSCGCAGGIAPGGPACTWVPVSNGCRDSCMIGLYKYCP